MTKSPRRLSRTECSVDVLAEAPRIDRVDTNVMPIINADAVAAVRRGSRIAFSSASFPVSPNNNR